MIKPTKPGKVLLLGATGFIGSHLAHRLLACGYEVRGLARSAGPQTRRLPSVEWTVGDLSRMTHPADWAAALADISIIVNAAGALQDSARDDLDAVQNRAMNAMYEAAKTVAPMIIQISANTRGAGSDTKFLATKQQADDSLAASGLPFAILRPALVIGRNAHGGTALVRALAATPWVTPMVYGDSPIQCVTIDHLADTVVSAINGDFGPKADVFLASSETHSLKSLVTAHRTWLGLPATRPVEVPQWFAAFASRAADIAGWLGWRSPLRSTAMKVMTGGVTVPLQSRNAASMEPLSAFLRRNPAGAQDLWFARLYLLKPVLVFGLALFWVMSGLIALTQINEASEILVNAGFEPRTSALLTIVTSLLDMALGAGVLFRRWARPALIAMALVSLAYLVAATFLTPFLWTDPLGPLVKIIPSILLPLATLSILDER